MEGSCRSKNHTSESGPFIPDLVWVAGEPIADYSVGVIRAVGVVPPGYRVPVPSKRTKASETHRRNGLFYGTIVRERPSPVGSNSISARMAIGSGSRAVDAATEPGYPAIDPPIAHRPSTCDRLDPFSLRFLVA